MTTPPEGRLPRPTGRPAIEPDHAPAVAAAGLVIAAHVADPDHADRCRSCWDDWGIWTPHPCTARRWAERTLIIAHATEENIS